MQHRSCGADHQTVDIDSPTWIGLVHAITAEGMVWEYFLLQKSGLVGKWRQHAWDFSEPGFICFLGCDSLYKTCNLSFFSWYRFWCFQGQLFLVLTSRLSGTWKSRTLSICVPFFSSISSSFWAWTTVRGKPSKTNPTLHSGRLLASSMRPTTNSSETRPPAFIAFSACKKMLHSIQPESWYLRQV